MTLPANALLFRDNAPQVAILGPDNRIVLKKIRIARDLGSEVEIAGGLSQDERIVANPPDSIDDGEEVRVVQAAGRRPERRQDNKLDKGRAIARRALRRSRKQGGTATNEVADVARGADRACARRLRFCAAVRPAFGSVPSKFKDETASGTDASSQRRMVAQLQRSDAQRSSGAGRCSQPRSCRRCRGQ